MNFIKIILICAGLIVVAMLAFSLLGIVYGALWYLFLFGIAAIGGTIGYRLLKKDSEQSQLEDKMPVVIADMQNADRTLEEYRRKYLPK